MNKVLAPAVEEIMKGLGPPAARSLLGMLALSFWIGACGPVANTPPLESTLAALQRFLQLRPLLRVSGRYRQAILEEGVENSRQASGFRLTLKKPHFSLVEQIDPETGAATRIDYRNGGDRTWSHSPQNKRAESWASDAIDPEADLKEGALPFGWRLYERFFLAPDLEGAFATLKGMSRDVGQESVGESSCRIVQIRRVRNLPASDAGGPVTDEQTCRIWIGRADGVPRRCVYEQKLVRGETPVLENRIEADYDAVETVFDAPDSSFAFTPPEGTRVFSGEEWESMDTGALLLSAGTPAPDFAALDLDGKAVRLSDLRGKVVVLNFWYYG